MYVGLLTSLASVTLIPTNLYADDASSAFAETYVGVWCGEDDEFGWRLSVDENGTYSQFNQPLPGGDSAIDAHFEFGSWSIEGEMLLRELEGIQYTGEEIRLVEPAWKFEFEIIALNSERLVINYKELNLLSQSTRECVDN